MLEKSSLTGCKPNQMLQDKEELGAGDSLLPPSHRAGASRAEAE